MFPVVVRVIERILEFCWSKFADFLEVYLLSRYTLRSNACFSSRVVCMLLITNRFTEIAWERKGSEIVGFFKSLRVETLALFNFDPCFSRNNETKLTPQSFVAQT